MLIVPASNVSVPLTVVMRMRSSVADSDFEPLVMVLPVALENPTLPEIIHKFEEWFVKTKEP